MAIRVSGKYSAEQEIIIAKLLRYRALVSEYQAVKELYNSWVPSGTRQLSSEPRARSNCYEPERFAIRREAIQAQMLRALLAIQVAYQEIEAMIDGLKGLEKTVILRRYTLNQTFDKIAMKLDCHRNTAINIHNRAIERLAIAMVDGVA
jgi:DNA-directed RNA polymerase specialized sigma24 family protein